MGIFQIIKLAFFSISLAIGIVTSYFIIKKYYHEINRTFAVGWISALVLGTVNLIEGINTTFHFIVISGMTVMIIGIVESILFITMLGSLFIALRSR